MARHVRFLGFKLDRDTVAAIAVGPECRDMTADAGNRAQDIAVGLSPRTSDPAKEHYADDFIKVPVIVQGITDEWPMDRVGVRLYNTSDYATDVEWGWAIRDRQGKIVGTVEGHHVMRNTLVTLEALHMATP